jgi:hypothetical protein
MTAVKTMRDQQEGYSLQTSHLQIWNANGNLHATLPFAKEKPRVSQLEIENPVMQLAI